MNTQLITPLSNFLNDTHGVLGINPHSLQKEGEAYALELFHQAAVRIPAYKAFLSEHDINPDTIQTIEDFSKVPLTDKKNYLDKYSLKELVWDGTLSNSIIINTSSGTTGQPYFWPSSTSDIAKDALVHEYIFKHIFSITKQTLFIITFGMGTWIAGSHTYQMNQLITLKGLPITVMTPGFNKEETIRILETIAPEYDSVIIAGIPTFIKDLLDTWNSDTHRGPLKKVKFLFAGEGFSESWREYMVGNHSLTDAISILGSADAALMGFETPDTISIRKLATYNKTFCGELFGQERVPALVTYIPTNKFFEIVENEVILSTDRTLPLIRYNMHDIGGIITNDQMQQHAKRYALPYAPTLTFPLLYIFGRGKFTATIFGANIYPEHVREVLLHEELRHKVTGKFTSQTIYTDKQNHILQINIELAPNVQQSEELSEQIANIFVTVVRNLSSEYHKIHDEFGNKARPQIVIHSYGDTTLFPTDKIKKTG